MQMPSRMFGNFADFFNISDGISSEKLHFSKNGIPAGIVCIGHPVKPLEAATKDSFHICYPIDDFKTKILISSFFYYMRSCARGTKAVPPEYLAAKVNEAHFCSYV